MATTTVFRLRTHSHPVKLLDAVSLGVAVAFAAPAGMLGVETLLAGDHTGWVFLGFAAAILACDRYVYTPTEIPALIAQSAATVVANPPDNDDDSDDAQ